MTYPGSHSRDGLESSLPAPQAGFLPSPRPSPTTPCPRQPSPKEPFFTVLCMLTFKHTTKQNKGFSRKQEELCCQPVPAATANPLDAAPKAEMGGGGGGLLVPLELWRAELKQCLRLGAVKGFLKDAASRTFTRVCLTIRNGKGRVTIPSFIDHLFGKY